jgi:hypothetical protein
MVFPTEKNARVLLVATAALTLNLVCRSATRDQDSSSLHQEKYPRLLSSWFETLTDERQEAP